MTNYLTDRAQESAGEFISEVRAIAHSARRQLPKLTATDDQQEVASLAAVAEQLERIADTVEGEPQRFRSAVSEVASVIERWKNRNDPPGL